MLWGQVGHDEIAQKVKVTMLKDAPQINQHMVQVSTAALNRP